MDRSSNTLGDRIVSGRTGLHRDILTQTMVPDVKDGIPEDAGLVGANGSVGLHRNGQ